MSLIITPIAQKNVSPAQAAAGKPDSKRDYDEQAHNLSMGDRWHWDVKESDNVVPGDVLGFVMQPGSSDRTPQVNFHQVIKVEGSQFRPFTWTTNVSHEDRRVVVLTDCKLIMSWDEWLRIGGHKVVRGTTKVSDKKKELTNHIIDRIRRASPVNLAR